MKQAQLNCAVFGLGRLGWRHAELLARGISGARLLAVADPDDNKLNSFTSQFGVKGYLDYREALLDSSIDAVLVVTPTTTHVQVSIEAANAGKQIFCEKPVAMSIADFNEIERVLNKTKVYFQVGFMRRFDAGYASAKRLIEEGVIGEVRAYNGITRDNGVPPVEYIRNSGGIYQDVLIHEFDIARYLMGSEIKELFSRGKSIMYEIFQDHNDSDHAYVFMDFENGALGNLEGSRCSLYGHDIRAEVIGTKGTLQIGYLQKTSVNVLTKAGISHDALQGFLERFGDAYTEEIKEFVDRIRLDKPSPVNVEDAKKAFLAAIASSVSQQKGIPVKISSISDEIFNL